VSSTTTGVLARRQGAQRIVLIARPTRDELVLGTTHVYPTCTYVIGVSGGPAPTVTMLKREWTGEMLNAAAYTLDGRRVIMAHGRPYYHGAVDSRDLSEAYRYNTDSYPNSVAVRSDGMVAAGISSGTRTIYVYDSGKTAWDHRYYDLGEDLSLAADGLAFGSDRLYAVAEEHVARYTLRSLDPDVPQPLPEPTTPEPDRHPVLRSGFVKAAAWRDGVWIYPSDRPARFRVGLVDQGAAKLVTLRVQQLESGGWRRVLVDRRGFTTSGKATFALRRLAGPGTSLRARAIIRTTSGERVRTVWRHARHRR
jgi:hypothetical protein